jgi:hypothetical protein
MDVDDDGLQEVVVTNAWKDKPPPWKYRWAVFHGIRKAGA